MLPHSRRWPCTIWRSHKQLYLMLAEDIHVWGDTRKDGDSHSLTYGLSLFCSIMTKNRFLMPLITRLERINFTERYSMQYRGPKLANLWRSVPRLVKCWSDVFSEIMHNGAPSREILSALRITAVCRMFCENVGIFKNKQLTVRSF